MAFEIVEPGQFAAAAPLPAGSCSIGKAGKLTLRTDDLEKHIGKVNYVIVLADAGSLRIALRQVRDGEQNQSVACSVTAGKGKRNDTRRAINIARALKRLGLTPEAAAGRYELDVKREPGRDSLLIVNLIGAGDKQKGQQA